MKTRYEVLCVQNIERPSFFSSRWVIRLRLIMLATIDKSSWNLVLIHPKDGYHGHPSHSDSSYAIIISAMIASRLEPLLVLFLQTGIWDVVHIYCDLHFERCATKTNEQGPRRDFRRALLVENLTQAPHRSLWYHGNRRIQVRIPLHLTGIKDIKQKRILAVAHLRYIEENKRYL